MIQIIFELCLIGGDVMARILSNKRISDGLVLAAIGISIFALIYYSEASASAAKDGLALCFNVIIPSLFPFFVMSSLIVELGFADKLGRLLEPIMQPLFNVSGVCAAAFILGFLGGYPLGAKTAIALYKNGSITRDEAERLLSFCNNSGPAFIFGVVGAGIFSSSLIGLILYATLLLSSVIVGILFRRWGRKGSKKSAGRTVRIVTVSYSNAFIQAVTGSFTSLISICSFVIFFTVLIKLLFAAGAIPWAASVLGEILAPIGLDGKWCEKLITGIIELTSGVWGLKEVASQLQRSITMAAFMLGWAGLSIHFQVISFIGGTGLSAKSYVLGKFLHGLISAFLISLIFRFFPLKAPVAAYLAEQVSGIASLDFRTALLISSIFSIMILLFFFVMSIIFCRKKYRKPIRKSV